MKFIGICGHRGSGCTDSPHAQSRNDGVSRPAENTIPSILQAFDDGASFVEIDAVQVKTGEIVVVHSDLLSDHVFYDCGAAKISELTLAEAQALKVAPDQSGKIPTLAELLAAIRPKISQGPVINIEIKGKKGTDGLLSDVHVTDFHDAILAAVGDFPLDRIIFSSFATYDLIEMRKRSRDAILAQLFDVPLKLERDVYPGQNISDARYLHFTPKNIAYAKEKAGIAYAHPAINSLNDKNVAACAAENIGINTWALSETPPDTTSHLKNALMLAKKHDAAIGIITDYVVATKKIVTSL